MVIDGAVWGKNRPSGGDSHGNCSEDKPESDSQYGEAAAMRHIPGGSHPVL